MDQSGYTPTQVSIHTGTRKELFIFRHRFDSCGKSKTTFIISLESSTKPRKTIETCREISKVTEKMLPRVLVIAGSDSSGGAYVLIHDFSFYRKNGTSPANK